MNEKLKQEIERFCLELDSRKAAWFELDEKDKDLLYSPTRATIAKEIAIHFYAFALEQAKSIINDKTCRIPRDNGDTMWNAALDTVFDAIENLSE